jgi:hypothetical protein
MVKSRNLRCIRRVDKGCIFSFGEEDFLQNLHLKDLEGDGMITLDLRDGCEDGVVSNRATVLVMLTFRTVLP